MENKKLGKVEINPSALSVIANIAATEVEGVSKLLGKKVYSRGVELEFVDNELIIDVNIRIYKRRNSRKNRCKSKNNSKMDKIIYRKWSTRNTE